MFAALLAIAPAVRPAAAQAEGGRDARRKDAGLNADSLMLWASVSLGVAVQSGSERVSGSASIWSTYHSTAFSIRRAGTAKVFEAGDRYDTSVLYGRRAPTKYVVIVGGVGVGISGGHDHTTTKALPSETVLAVGAEADLSARFAGIGLSAFGTFGQTRNYGGIGLSLALGRLR